MGTIRSLLHQRAPEAVLQVVWDQQAKLKSPPVPMADVLRSLAGWVPRFVELVRPHLR
jgi:hypothetical protein